MKWIKLFSGTTAEVEAQVNQFTADNAKLPVEFIEARPIQLHGSAAVGVLACVQYEAKAPIAEAAAETETTE